jgi:alkylation response protein AidB-like acyl-CoA dehydrogenase
MNATFTPEHNQLRHAVRRFLEAKSPSAQVRRLIETDRGYDPAVWAQMAHQLNLQGIAIPEEHGGLGFSAVELGIVCEEMGRNLLCAPYFATVALAAQTLLVAGDPAAQAEYLPRIADGSMTATVGMTEPDGRWDLAAVQCRADSAGDKVTVTGVKTYVVDGQVADVLFVVARIADGIGLFAVPGAGPGVTRTPLPTLDLTRKLARVELSAAPARRVSPAGDATGPLVQAFDLAVVALMAEQVGTGQRCLEMAVDYAKTRMQFGRAIGSFQAIKHKCADMLVNVELAKSAAYHACWAAAEAPEELPLAASLAKAYCAEAIFHVAAENIQVHGGIGFTWEHDAHLYFRRAKASQLMFGDCHHHRRRVAELIGV